MPELRDVAPFAARPVTWTDDDTRRAARTVAVRRLAVRRAAARRATTQRLARAALSA